MDHSGFTFYFGFRYVGLASQVYEREETYHYHIAQGEFGAVSEAIQDE
jgi:hypothetical protein